MADSLDPSQTVFISEYRLVASAWEIDKLCLFHIEEMIIKSSQLHTLRKLWHLNSHLNNRRKSWPRRSPEKQLPSLQLTAPHQLRTKSLTPPHSRNSSMTRSKFWAKPETLEPKWPSVATRTRSLSLLSFLSRRDILNIWRRNILRSSSYVISWTLLPLPRELTSSNTSRLTMRVAMTTRFVIQYSALLFCYCKINT